MFCVNNCFQAALRLEYHGGRNGISRGMRSRLIPTQNIAFLKTPVRQQPPHPPGVTRINGNSGRLSIGAESIVYLIFMLCVQSCEV